MAHKALCKIMLYKALKIPLIRPRKSLYIIIEKTAYTFENQHQCKCIIPYFVFRASVNIVSHNLTNSYMPAECKIFVVVTYIRWTILQEMQKEVKWTQL